MVTILLFSISSYAVEVMSSEEIEIRERHDQVSKKLYECFAINNIDPRNIDDSVCKKEREDVKRSGKEFNEFMSRKRAKEAEVPFEIRKKRYKEFLKKYSSFTEDMLKELHETHCQTKWGSSVSSECNAIAQQLAKKRIQRLRSK